MCYTGKPLSDVACWTNEGRLHRLPAGFCLVSEGNVLRPRPALPRLEQALPRGEAHAATAVAGRHMPI
ncbi:hypothetical protein NDU88_005518 [Pleurodeles waltl]|uniref:Uncharacterized protein n=1 Tax=Pleurodeles waltl TaxID=8319 RepID=A0AAV7LN01_PLEWA|nr:hypothetical protein NDU88_005518 [Pleurodeles waltl]